jgi:CRISPR-associated protein Csb2
VDESTKTEEAVLGPLGENDYVFGRYVARARNWATVTPVVLPWGDSGKPHRAEKQFLKAMRHAGYSPDSIDEFELRREPFWRGIDLARNYFVPRHLRGTAVYHVRLRWKHRLDGPLAIGSGRFCGLGLFASLDK